MQQIIHYSLHFILPIFIALLFFKKRWLSVYSILAATMLVDIDHLWATPIFEANRCSIGFHTFHSYYAIAIYFLLLFFKRPFNIIGLGLLLHMITDLIDCLFMYHHCSSCMATAPAFELQKTITNWLH